MKTEQEIRDEAGDAEVGANNPYPVGSREANIWDNEKEYLLQRFGEYCDACEAMWNN